MADKKTYPSDKQDQYMVRFPAGMRETLKRLASDANRSLNAEIVARLDESLTAERDVSDLYKLLDQTYDERRQLSETIHSQDVALQTVRRSHRDLVTIAKELGGLFLANQEGQPEYLIVLAKALASFEIDDDEDKSAPVEGIDWDQYPPDPSDEIARRKALKSDD